VIPSQPVTLRHGAAGRWFVVHRSSIDARLLLRPDAQTIEILLTICRRRQDLNRGWRFQIQRGRASCCLVLIFGSVQLPRFASCLGLIGLRLDYDPGRRSRALKCVHPGFIDCRWRWPVRRLLRAALAGWRWRPCFRRQRSDRSRPLLRCSYQGSASARSLARRGGAATLRDVSVGASPISAGPLPGGRHPPEARASPCPVP
jgi:hypothetical protein